MKTKNILLTVVGLLIIGLVFYALFNRGESNDEGVSDGGADNGDGDAPDNGDEPFIAVESNEKIDINGEVFHCVKITDEVQPFSINTNITNWFNSLRNYGIVVNSCTGNKNHNCRFDKYENWGIEVKKAFTFFKLVNVAPTPTNTDSLIDYIIEWVEQGPDWQYNSSGVERGKLRCGHTDGFIP